MNFRPLLLVLSNSKLLKQYAFCLTKSIIQEWSVINRLFVSKNQRYSLTSLVTQKTRKQMTQGAEKMMASIHNGSELNRRVAVYARLSFAVRSSKTTPMPTAYIDNTLFTNPTISLEERLPTSQVFHFNVVCLKGIVSLYKLQELANISHACACPCKIKFVHSTTLHLSIQCQTISNFGIHIATMQSTFSCHFIAHGLLLSHFFVAGVIRIIRFYI